MASLEELIKSAEGQNWILIVPVPLEFPKIRINIHTNIKDLESKGIVSGVLFHAAKISLSNEAKNVRPEGVPVRSEPKPEDRPVEAPEAKDQDAGGESDLPSGTGA